MESARDKAGALSTIPSTLLQNVLETMLLSGYSRDQDGTVRALKFLEVKSSTVRCNHARYPPTYYTTVGRYMKQASQTSLVADSGTGAPLARNILFDEQHHTSMQQKLGADVGPFTLENVSDLIFAKSHSTIHPIAIPAFEPCKENSPYVWKPFPCCPEPFLLHQSLQLLSFGQVYQLHFRLY